MSALTILLGIAVLLAVCLGSAVLAFTLWTAADNEPRGPIREFKDWIPSSDSRNYCLVGVRPDGTRIVISTHSTRKDANAAAKGILPDPQYAMILIEEDERK